MVRQSWLCVAAAMMLSMVSGCGGGGGGDSNPPASAPNVLAVTVDTGPAGVTPNVNIPFVSIRICAPGSTTACQTIDHILLDTASTGLRIMASVLNPAVVLPDQTDDSGHALTECLAFISGYVWGSVKQADVQLAGRTASSLPIQIVGDSTFAVPASCSSRGSGSMNTVSDFGANGVLGISQFVADCDAPCAQAVPISGAYYVCSGSTCSPVSVSVSKQVQNPVAALDQDNNGFMVEMAAVPAAGAATATGSLILGIGTQANNVPGGATKLDLDSYGDLVTTYKNQIVSAFFDTGSNGLFFPDAGIPDCTSPLGWYCPTSTQDLTAVVRGATTGTANVDFSIANIHTLMTANPTYTAYGNIGAYWGNSFDWGLPFYYGRRVFTAIEQRSTPNGTGPYIAF
jgi:hypothetical protein